MNILIASDHAGFEYKKTLIEQLSDEGHSVKDFGTSGPESVDYPDYVHPLAKEMVDTDGNMAILICGSGNGVAITANKHAHVRAALCWNKDIARLARLHNNANAIAIPARMVSVYLAKEMVDVFLNTAFEGGRHQRRVDKMICS